MAEPRPKQAAASLFSGYRPLPGVPDELVSPAGEIRPSWAGLLHHLENRSPRALEADLARGDQYLRDAGVFFRNYSNTATTGRDWPLSPLPVILHDTEWHEIARGLMQRADLLETVVADLYGPGQLVAEGLLPAALIAGNPEWLRPLVGVTPRSGRFLHFLAFELGRGPDGRWWVLGDRTQAPSGAGFALENRVATARVFPDLYRRSNVHRLAGFFRAFRDALDGLRGTDTVRAGSKMGILTPGPMTDTYYEQAYIARYLGLPLLEGGDLMVEGDALKVRTVSGPVPIDVLWRRLDSAWADPLELEEASHLGTPGLLTAIRAGTVTMVNALGSGILETQALMAFLPNICHTLNGADLALPNIATWWCGDPVARRQVRAEAERMLVGPALATRLPYETDGVHAVAGTLRGASGTFDAWLEDNAENLVGQELVTLSTTPVLERRKLVPRPMTIRVFLARTPEGWEVMPGGFARIGKSSENAAISMRQGSSVADVWVVSDTPVREETLLSHPTHVFTRAEPPTLPGRAADNLFWLGRYVERTEGLLRMIRSYHGRLSETGNAPLLKSIDAYLKRHETVASDPLPIGVLRTLGSAVNSASRIRDRFSVDGWAALSDIEKSMKRIASSVRAGDDAAAAMGVFLRKIAGFSGLVHENMYRAESWRFLTIGRSLERAAGMAELLSVFADRNAPSGSLDLAIELGDSIMTHRQRYAVAASRESVVDLLALDPQNPRSIHFHLSELRHQAAALAGGLHAGHMSDFERMARSLETRVAILPIALATSDMLASVRRDVLALSDALADAYLF